VDPLTDAPGPAPKDLARENLYLRQRVAQLQEDVTSLSAESDRLRQTLERLHGRAAAQRPDPPGGAR
jgi:prefoldin subunit 5